MAKNENIPNINRQFADNSSKKYFHEISPKSFPKDFRWFSNFPKIDRKLTENFPKNSRSRVLWKHLPKFYNFPKFSETFETILVNVRCLFCLAAEFIKQDGATCLMISQSNCKKAGQDE